MRPFLVFVAILFPAVLAAETVRCPVTRDLWVSSAPGEEEGNNGAAPRLKLKGYQEFSILDFDLSAAGNRDIRRAVLHVKLSGPERLRRVGVSTLGSEWIEGSGTSYARDTGASSFRRQSSPGTPWTPPPGDSDLTAVMFGLGGTFWSHAPASEPDADGWQRIEIDPRIVAARRAGISYGFVLFDDTGTEIRRDADDPEKVLFHPFPNRFIYSRDQNVASAPYLTLELAPPKAKLHAEPPPGRRIGHLRTVTENLPPGEARLLWDVSPPEDGDLLGFFVQLNGRDVPRSMIPVPDAAKFGNLQTLAMTLRDPALTPGERVDIEIVAVLTDGVRSAPTRFRFRLPEAPAPFALPETPRLPSGAGKRKPVRPTFSGLSVSILDELDKVAEDGSLIPPRPEDYFAANHLWDVDTEGNRLIRLDSLRSEFVAFQIHLEGRAKNVRPSFTWKGSEDGIPKAEFYRFEYVDSPRGRIADPLIPLEDAGIDVEGRETLYGEIFVPKSARPGVHAAALRLAAEDGTLDITLLLEIHDAALPDRLGFLPEMNCYGLPENERDYYRLAQLHRTYLNRVPYSHRGTVAKGCAPVWDAARRRFDWTDWDSRFGPYFDGSAFADLPRGPIPVEAFYLPLHENFPANIFRHYTSRNEGDDWADEVLPEVYAEEFKAGCRETARHLAAKGGSETCFHFFLNNKSDYKRGGWSRGSSTWLLDEPAAYRDFAALRWFGLRFHEATDSIAAPIRFRCDISRPQWQRDSLDGLLGVNVVGGDAFRRFNRLVNERKERFGEILYVYGTACKPEEGAVQPVAWSLDAWTLGADGLVPWQTVGNDKSWRESDELALLYPGREGMPPVVASQRLKAFRRGQQDVEYLILLAQKENLSRHRLADTIRKTVSLAPEHRSEDAEDAGTDVYSKLTPVDLWDLRQRVRQALLHAR